MGMLVCATPRVLVRSVVKRSRETSNWAFALASRLTIFEALRIVAPRNNLLFAAPFRCGVFFGHLQIAVIFPSRLADAFPEMRRRLPVHPSWPLTLANRFSRRAPSLCRSVRSPTHTLLSWLWPVPPG